MSDNPASGPTADFGFRRVPAVAKKGLVREVFDSVAPRYDLMNDLMSLGIHRAWKRILVSALDPRPERMLLDLAGGTGDVSFGWLGQDGGTALLSDINAQMLSVARDRALARGIGAGLHCLVADAGRVPLPDRVVDRVSIAFGLRNCTDKQAVLTEARRMLKPGGRFFCLEFSRLRVAALAPAYEAWSFQVLPRLGRAVAGLNAYSKGRRLGLFKPDEEKAKKAREKEPGTAFKIDICGQAVPAQNTEDGVRATQRGKPIHPDSVERYLKDKCGDDLKAERSAMEKLARAYKPKDLAGKAYSLYEAFRPEIPAGKRGWGAKGDHIRMTE